MSAPPYRPLTDLYHKFFLECFFSSSSSEQGAAFNSVSISTVYIVHKLMLLGLKAFCRELFPAVVFSPQFFACPRIEI